MPTAPQKPGFFLPILAGATWRDRVIACLGAFAGICVTYLLCRLTPGSLTGDMAHLPYLVAPMGASAVLLFAVPASPLAQPWPIIGGNTISAAIGILVALLLPDPILAAGIAVALAIAVMSLCRCLHPPGGAAALLAVLGGHNVTDAGLLFALDPVAINAVLITLVGLGYHRLLKHNYPHKPLAAPVNTHGTTDAVPGLRIGFTAGDIDGALADLGEAFDIDRADLDQLLSRVELRALERSHGNLTCADIMSRDIVHVAPTTAIDEARALLLQRNLRMLPVVDSAGKVLGTVGLRELLKADADVAAVMSAAWTTTAEKPAIDLIAPLTDGKTHAAVITDAAHHLVGVVTQTDLLATLGRVPVAD
ncbi:HPP family protein [Dongia rigui]|uniref:HPP family protein n=1 Tax=Dongia rigui TaxID=940149 RepID=A0ABU5DWK7_9PROT|nr:HPP family protein [Dongia rigui]MDY0871659.1 HPP family protein [Dongia rigui]